MDQQSSGIDYKALEQRQINKSKAALRQKLADQSDMGRPGSLRRVILGFVVGEKYEQGRDELLAHIERKREYPNFQNRVNRFVTHACDLIQAIQTKRTFPGLSSLSLSKQQEVMERVLQHFEELKQTLRTIERVEKDVRLEDLRSTAWVVRTLAHCVLLITAVAFLTALAQGNIDTFLIVFNALVDDIVHWVAAYFHWKIS